MVMDNSYPPYVFRDKAGNLQGISVDLWRTWERKTGIRADIHTRDWGVALQRMEAGEFDVIDTIFDQPSRRLIFDLTRPYASIEVFIFFRKDISGIVNVSSLKGFPVAVKSGDAAEDMLKQNGVITLPFPNYETMVDAAKDGKINVFVSDGPPTLYFLNLAGIEQQFRRSAPLAGGSFHRATRKGNDALLALVESGFAAVTDDEKRAIEQRWLGQDLPRSPYFRYVSYAAAAALVVVVMLAGWNWSLRRRVTTRTAELEESERRFRQIAENIREVFWLTDPLRKSMFYISPAFETVWGRSCASLYAAPQLWLESIHPEDRERVEHAVRTKQVQGAYDEEFRIVRPDGSTVWVRDQAFPIRNAAGVVHRIAGLAEEITARKQIEESLRRLVAEQRTLAEQLQAETSRLAVAQAVAKIGSWETDALTGKVTWSDETHRIFETDPQTFQPTHAAFLQLVHPDDRSMVDEAFGRSLVMKTRNSLEHRLLLPSGRAKVVEERWQIFTDQRGEVTRAVGTCQDVTTRVESAAALRQSETRFRTIFEQAGIGIAMVDITEGTILQCNPALAEMFGYSVTELCGLTVEAVSEPSGFHADQEQLAQLLAGKFNRFQLEKRYRKKSGQLIWGLLTSTVVRDPAGTSLFILGMVEDISARKRAQVELAAADRRLHALIGRLHTVREEEGKRIARELHDNLGQQLTALNLEMDRLERRLPTPSLQQREEFDRMHRIVDGTIEVVQKISGELRHAQLDMLGLGPAIEWQLKEFSERTGVRFRVETMDECPNLSEAVNVSLLRILQEALTNIARHAHATEIVLSLTCREGLLHLTIQDDGRGITQAESGDHLSLGLLGMRERASLAGGTVEVSGRPNRGTMIRVEIPDQATIKVP